MRLMFHRAFHKPTFHVEPTTFHVKPFHKPMFHVKPFHVEPTTFHMKHRTGVEHIEPKWAAFRSKIVNRRRAFRAEMGGITSQNGRAFHMEPTFHMEPSGGMSGENGGIMSRNGGRHNEPKWSHNAGKWRAAGGGISGVNTRHKRSKYIGATAWCQSSVHEGSTSLAKHIWAVFSHQMLNIFGRSPSG